MSANLIALQNRFLGKGETVYDRLARLAEEKGALADADLLALATELGLPPAHVRSVAKFYDDLKKDAPAQRTLKVCNGEACAVRGAASCHEKLAASLASVEGVRVEEVTCLGYCGAGPNAMLDEAHHRQVFSLDGEGLASVEKALLSGEPVEIAGPENTIHAPKSERENVLLSRFGRDFADLAHARKQGVYAALGEALKHEPQAVVDAVKASQIRGRGGAGF
ncbi:MAG: NAD(P)H-dependent oxidoreductase subunit E, partial [Myxococcales bacterium]|nr:NAD(P)H-dependent oxidoreductase subunit E [Myxococcales bacterium]